MSATFRLKVITPQKLFFDDETENVIVRTTVGDVGILAKHIDYVAVLPAGPLKNCIALASILLFTSFASCLLLFSK